MIVVHIESGLGNQMLSYCEYLLLKHLHPDEDIYIETVVYDIPECNEVINQWNGYELNRIFGINAPNIKSCFSDEKWHQVMSDIRESDFWDKSWNYAPYITDALNKEGSFQLKNIRGDFEAENIKNFNNKIHPKPSLKERFIDTYLGDALKRLYYVMRKEHFIRRANKRDKIFYKGNDSIFTGQWLALKSRNSGIEIIKKEIESSFVFPDWNDGKNREMASFLKSCESVAIHARRGDMLSYNGYCYKFGYFKRAIRHIKRNVNNPVFVFFCDPKSVDWCKENASIFNLDLSKDKVYFVDWNKGEESFRDMQLMSCCKHAVITNSSFGWWGAYFIKNPNKITISPQREIALNTTCHC